MFCPNCGQPNQDGARFCASCGGAITGAAPAAPASQPAAAPAPPAASPFAGQPPCITGFVQGVDREYRANGDYDSIDLGTITPDDALKIVHVMLPQSPPDGDDICPISASFKGPGAEIAFYVESGAVLGVESGTQYTPEQLVARVMGQLGAPPPKAGWQPARKHHVPPTDQDTWNTAQVDTGPSSPQVAVRVWGNGICGPGLFGFMFLPLVTAAIIALAALGAADFGVAFGALAGTALCLWLLKVIWSKGHEYVRVGLDWKVNALWVHRDGQYHYTPNANCIRQFISKKLYDDPESTATTLRMDRTDNESDVIGGLDFEKKTEGPRVAVAVNGLLASQ